jgi:hypothetical protein
LSGNLKPETWSLNPLADIRIHHEVERFDEKWFHLAAI